MCFISAIKYTKETEIENLLQHRTLTPSTSIVNVRQEKLSPEKKTTAKHTKSQCHCHHAVNMFRAENPIPNSIFGSEKVNQIKFIIVQSVECTQTVRIVRLCSVLGRKPLAQ